SPARSGTKGVLELGYVDHNHGSPRTIYCKIMTSTIILGSQSTICGFGYQLGAKTFPAGYIETKKKAQEYSRILCILYSYLDSRRNRKEMELFRSRRE
ncbi:hypothetical protein MKW98_010448, partial [Papaver atlanticum]